MTLRLEKPDAAKAKIEVNSYTTCVEPVKVNGWGRGVKHCLRAPILPGEVMISG